MEGSKGSGSSSPAWRSLRGQWMQALVPLLLLWLVIDLLGPNWEQQMRMHVDGATAGTPPTAAAIVRLSQHLGGYDENAHVVMDSPADAPNCNEHAVQLSMRVRTTYWTGLRLVEGVREHLKPLGLRQCSAYSGAVAHVPLRRGLPSLPLIGLFLLAGWGAYKKMRVKDALPDSL